MGRVCAETWGVSALSSPLLELHYITYSCFGKIHWSSELDYRPAQLKLPLVFERGLLLLIPLALGSRGQPFQTHLQTAGRLMAVTFLYAPTDVTSSRDRVTTPCTERLN